MTQYLHIPNLNKFITHLEAQPAAAINMGHEQFRAHPCGTCGCILGHAELIWALDWMADDSVITQLADLLGLKQTEAFALTHPEDWYEERDGVRRYPAHRVIATLKRLRDRFLATGKVVVDWGAEPTEGQPWSPPHATEIRDPELPEALTRLLGASADVVTVE